jgi:hypothetical protein
MNALRKFCGDIVDTRRPFTLNSVEAWHITCQQLPESEGHSSEAITSTETSGLPARQSGSPEVDPSGERQLPTHDAEYSAWDGTALSAASRLPRD